MLPDNVLSSQVIFAPFLSPRDAPPRTLVDYERGGNNISDPSAGLMTKAWRARYIDGNFVLDATGVPDTVIFSAEDVTEFSFTFDQNMKPFLTYIQGGVPKYRWWDGTLGAYAVVDLPAGALTPKCALDDKRLLQVSISDIILAYILNGNLYYRQQRDRFGTERLLKENVGGYLRRIGMNTLYRFQFEIGH